MTWIVFALCSAFFAALVAIFGKIGMSSIDTTLATTVRAAIMAVFLVIVSLILGKTPLLSTLNARALWFIVFAGIAGALSWLFYFGALKMGPASGVAALDRISVVIVLILAFLFLGEEFSAKSVVGALLLTVGAVLMTIR